jgi:hypothetical protein
MAVTDGLCLVHAGAQDMKALGRRGGSVRPLTKLRKQADDELREKARLALAEALDSSDERRRFEAARSLFSYRPTEAPREERKHEAPTGKRGRPVVGLADVIAFAEENNALGALGIERVVWRTPSHTGPAVYDDAGTDGNETA